MNEKRGTTTDELTQVVEAVIRRPYHRVIHGSTEGGFIAEIAEFPGCLTAAETPQEALANLDEATELWLETAVLFGDAIPEPASALVAVA